MASPSIPVIRRNRIWPRIGGFICSRPMVKPSASDANHDFMGFVVHPTAPNQIYGSGHPVGGGNLGFIASTDGGKTWRQLSPGVKGPVDFMP